MRLTGISVAITVAGVFALAACSSSPRDDLAEAADAKCHTITERFTSDLSYGGSAGRVKLEQRTALVEDLAAAVRAMPPPDSGQAEFVAWLAALDKHIAELTEFDTLYRTAGPGSDLVLAMEVSIVDDTVAPVGAAAKRFGLADCADVHAWVTFPK